MSPQPKGMLEMRKSIKLTAFATMMVAGLATTALYAQEAQTPDKQSPMMEHDGNSGMGDMQGMMGMMKMMSQMGPMMEQCTEMMAAMTDHMPQPSDK